MQTPVKISEIVETMDMQFDELSAYFDRRTGRILVVTGEEFDAAETGDALEDYPEWEHEQIEIAQQILSDEEGVYVRLPSRYEIHEWRIIDDFARSIEDEHISRDLQSAIRGTGAFRRFKDAIYRLGVAEQWYSFKEQALREIARAWCEKNGIPFEEG